MPGIQPSQRQRAQSGTPADPTKSRDKRSWRQWVLDRDFDALRIGGLATPRLVGQVFSIGGDDFLDGSFVRDTSREMAQALHSLHKCLPAGPERDTVRAVQAQLERVSRWAKEIKNAAKGIPPEKRPQTPPPAKLMAEMSAALMTHTRVLLPASVTGSSNGHGMLVEVLRQSDSRYTIRVFNSGQFDAFQHGVYSQGMLQGHTDFSDVPADVVHSRKFVHALLSLNYATHRSTLDNIEALYDWASEHGQHVGPTGEMHRKQSVRNCAWKCVSGYVRLNLPAPLYLRLKAQHRARVLADYGRSASFPMWVHQWVTLVTPAVAWHAPFGMPMPVPVWHPVGHAYMPVGLSWYVAASDAPLLALAHEQLAKTQSRLAQALAGPTAPTNR